MIGALIGAGVALAGISYIALAFLIGGVMADRGHGGWGFFTTLALIFMAVGAIIGTAIQGGM